LHEHQALSRREIGDPAAGNGKPLEDAGRRMFTLGLEEKEWVAPEVTGPIHHRGVEAASHRGRAGDGIGAGGLADPGLDVDDRLGAVTRHRHSRERKMATVRSIQVRGQRSELLDLCNGAHTDLAGGILPGVLPGTGCRTNREGSGRSTRGTDTSIVSQVFSIVKIS